MSARPRFPANHWRAADYEARREAKMCFYDTDIDWPEWDASNQGRAFDVPAGRTRWTDVMFSIAFGLAMCGFVLAALGALIK